MSQSLANILIHLVFSTKGRQPLLADKFRNELHAYIGGVLHERECPLLRINSVEDHLHLLFSLSRKITVSDLVKEIKISTTNFIRRKDPDLSNFFWQGGYGAFSISPGHKDLLIAYIDKQKEHHQCESFQDELRRLLAKYQIEWDERYVWD